MVIKYKFDRQLIHSLNRLKDQYPILAITGPRQSGKTTLLKHFFEDYTYVSLEDPDLRDFAKSDPRGFLDKYSNKTIFDEVQRTPELFSYFQGKVDDSGIMGQFILSGSQNFHLVRSITQSLAGRVALFHLMPLDFMEMQSEGLLDDSYTETIFKGFYPALFSRSIQAVDFFANYTKTYVQRDISELINVHDTRQFNMFIKMCAARSGQLLNISSLARSCGISQPTARGWLSILESSYLIFLLHPYYKNFNKRLIKSPKLYFYDTGLLCYLLDIHVADDLTIHPMKGHLFENMVIAEFYKNNFHQYLHEEYWFWRDSNGHEIDFLRKSGPLLDIFEIKSTKTITSSLMDGLKYFESIAGKDRILSKNLIYGGHDRQKRSEFYVKGWKNIHEGRN